MGKLCWEDTFIQRSTAYLLVVDPLTVQNFRYSVNAVWQKRRSSYLRNQLYRGTMNPLSPAFPDVNLFVEIC